MNHFLLSKIYNNAVVSSHADVRLPDIKPEFKVYELKPSRTHHNLRTYG